jgi:hypothetical protein
MGTAPGSNRAGTVAAGGEEGAGGAGTAAGRGQRLYTSRGGAAHGAGADDDDDTARGAGASDEAAQGAGDGAARGAGDDEGAEAARGAECRSGTRSCGPGAGLGRQRPERVRRWSQRPQRARRQRGVVRSTCRGGPDREDRDLKLRQKIKISG